MEKTCRTCVHRKNYECTCKELRESIFLESDFALLGLNNEIESIVTERLGNILDNLLEDEDTQKILDLLAVECLGDEIVDMVKETQEDSTIELNLSNDFVCKYWR